MIVAKIVQLTVNRNSLTIAEVFSVLLVLTLNGGLLNAIVNPLIARLHIGRWIQA